MGLKLRVLTVILIVALAASAGYAKNPVHLNKVVLHAQGDVSVDPSAPSVVSLLPLSLPPELMPALQAGAVKIIAVTDVADSNAYVQVWVATGPATPTPGIPLFPISVFTIGITDMVMGDIGPEVGPTIAFTGKVIDNAVPSPFGKIVGRAAAISAEFDQAGTNVHFKFVGGFVAGSHSTWTMAADGSLYLPPSD